jgi:hypothetical protein
MKGNELNWVVTMFEQMHKELMRWTTFQTKMMMGITKVEPKKYVYHLTLIIEILM